MIKCNQSPVAWAQFKQELDDARDHLVTLLGEMDSDSAYGEENLRIDLGHVYAHLNRAWNSRNSMAALSGEEWERFREFPNDIHPIA